MRQFRANNGLRENVRLTRRDDTNTTPSRDREPHRYLRSPQRAPGRVIPGKSLERPGEMTWTKTRDSMRKIMGGHRT